MSPDHGAITPHAFFMRSARLGFATWRDGDFALASSIWGDPEVTRLTGGPFDPAHVKARLAQEITNLDRADVQYWPIFCLDTRVAVGCCGLRPRLGEARVFELGFQLCRNAWGRGYAIEAARRVIEWAVSRDITALIAGHHPENHGSRHILLALGFVYTHDEFYPPTGQLEPCYRLALNGPAS